MLTRPVPNGARSRDAAIEPTASYPVDPARLRHLRGPRTMAELVAGIAGFSSEKYRKIEAGKTRSMVGTELLALARKLRVPATALLSPDHPDRTPISGNAKPSAAPPPLTSGQSRGADRVIDGLAEGARVQTLIGPRGVGKSTLAMHVFARLHGHLGTLVRFVPLLDQCQPWELWQALGAVQNADPGRTRADLLDHIRDDVQVLVLDVDGVPSTPAMEQIETILEQCGHLKLIAFAERPVGPIGGIVESIEPVRFDAASIQGAEDLGASDAWQLVVDELPRERAMALLSGTHLVQLITVLGMGDGTPRWFVALGRELCDRDPGDLLGRLRMHQLSFSADEDKTWEGRVHRAAQLLAPDHLAWLAILPQRFALEDVSGLGGLTSAEIERVLEVAVDHWMIDRVEERFVITRRAQRACVHRDLAAYVCMVDALIARLPRVDNHEALAGFDVHDHMTALHLAVEHASSRQLPELATRVIELLVPACLQPTRWQDVSAMAATLERRLAGVEEISSVPLARWAATGALVTGELDAAKYWTDRCLTLATKQVHRAAGLNLRAACRLGGPSLTRPVLEAALEDWSEARRLYQEVEDTISVQSMDANIAHVHESLGDLVRALTATNEWSKIEGVLRVQMGTVRARVLLRMGRSHDALRVIEAIRDDEALLNPFCSIAFCIVLAFAALDRDGIAIPGSRLEDPSTLTSIHDCAMANEALAHSKLIAKLDGLDPGILDRTDWAWIESVVGPAKPENFHGLAHIKGVAEQVVTA